MYACETWTLNTDVKRRLEATEMWFLRRMLRIPWTARKSNKEILQDARERRTLINKIRKRQAIFFGHVMRRENMEHLITTGKIQDKRSPGRQRTKMLDDLTAWLGGSRNTETIGMTRDRERWKTMVSNAYRLGT